MRSVLLLCFIGLFVSNSFAQSGCLPTNGLVLWLPFCGNANDQSGNGNNGTVNGATLTTDRFGNAASAYSFNGSSTSIPIANRFFNSGWNEFTVSMWANSNTFNVQNSNNCQTLINTIPHNAFAINANWGSDGKWNLLHNSNPPAGGWDILGNAQSKTPFTINNWVHILLVKSGTNYKLYINGQLDSSYVGPKPALSYMSSIIIGRDDPAVYTEFFSGKLDDVGIWNRALTPQEIQQVFQTNYCVAANAPTISSLRDTVCAGGAPILTATGGFGTYQWQYSLTPSNFNDLVGLTGSVCFDIPIQTSYYRVYTGGSCPDTSAPHKVFVNLLPLANFTSQQSGMEVTFNSSGSASGIVKYDWDFGDGGHSNLPNPVHTYSYSDSFLVCLTAYDQSDCPGIDCHKVSLDFATEITETFGLNNFRIYPNPATDKIYVRPDFNGEYQCSLINLLGEEIKSRSCSGVAIMDVSDIMEGLYTLKFSFQKKSVQAKQLVLRK